VSFFDNTGQLVAQDSVPVNGILLSDLQTLAGAVTLSSSGKVFFETGTDGMSANRFGLFSQSLGTFASGQRMPAVDLGPQARPTPAQPATPGPSPTSGPTSTPAPTQTAPATPIPTAAATATPVPSPEPTQMPNPPQTITVSVGAGGFSFDPANVT